MAGIYTMQELVGIMKILGGAVGFFGCVVTFIAWFVKRTISQFDEKDQKLQGDINNLKQTAAILDKEVAVLQEGKIGRDELRQELTKVEETFSGQLKDLKEDLREDLSDIKSMLLQREGMRRRDL